MISNLLREELKSPNFGDAVTRDLVRAVADKIEQLEAALRGAYTLPRPWMDGGVTWHEWDAAISAIEAANQLITPGRRKA